MTATGDQLAAAARAVHRARRGAHAAAGMIRSGEIDEARRQAEEAGRAADNALELLLAAGAPRPGSARAADSLPLGLLDTPASRRLLAAAEEAARAGAEVDRERGWLQDGEPCGWGETFAGLALTLRVEVEGPKGGGRE